MNKRFHFLIIEESLAARIVMRSQLMGLDQHVDITPSLEDAFDKIIVIPYDILLIDSYSYKKINSLDMTPPVIKNLQIKTMPIIAIIGEQELELNQNHLSEGTLLYFKKPFTEESAMKIIHYIKTAKEL